MVRMFYIRHVLERVGFDDEKVVSVLGSFKLLEDANAFAKQRVFGAEEFSDIDFLYKERNAATGRRRLIAYINEKEYRHVWVEKQRCPPRNSPEDDSSFPPLYDILISTDFAIDNPDFPQRSRFEIHPNIYATVELLNDAAKKT